MKLWNSVFLVLLFCGNASWAIDITTDIFVETAAQILNEASYLNPNNLHDYNEFKNVLRGTVGFKSEFLGYANGMLKLAAFYNVTDYQSKASNEAFFIKEMYVDILGPVIFRVGKQYIQWGSTLFFNNIDMVNQQKELLSPLDEGEGNPSIYMSIPINNFLTIDMMSVIDPKEATKISALPLIPRISSSFGLVSGFIFTKLELEKKPVFGANLDFAFNLATDISATLYGSFAYKGYSERNRVVKEASLYKRVGLGKDYYISTVAGAMTIWSFPYTPVLDGINFIIECYFDMENWTGNQLNTFFDYLNTLRNDKIGHSQAVADYKVFHNSLMYLYLSLSLQSIMVSDLVFRVDSILNLSDFSCLIMPELSYSFDNTNATVGAKVIVPVGDGKDEFGNLLNKLEAILFIQLSY